MQGLLQVAWAFVIGAGGAAAIIGLTGWIAYRWSRSYELAALVVSLVLLVMMAAFR